MVPNLSLSQLNITLLKAILLKQTTITPVRRNHRHSGDLNSTRQSIAHFWCFSPFPPWSEEKRTYRNEFWRLNHDWRTYSSVKLYSSKRDNGGLQLRFAACFLRNDNKPRREDLTMRFFAICVRNLTTRPGAVGDLIFLRHCWFSFSSS